MDQCWKVYGDLLLPCTKSEAIIIMVGKRGRIRLMKVNLNLNMTKHGDVMIFDG